MSHHALNQADGRRASCSTSHAPTEAASTPRDGRTGQRRLVCNVCGHRIDPSDQSRWVTFPCHVRAFLGQGFDVWRCPGCRTIHCLDRVDLDHYYAHYPFATATLTWPFRLFYRKLLRHLARHGFTKDRSLLDYGCGNGVFVRYLRNRGYRRCQGYDPYAEVNGFGDPANLQQGPFDFILLQDVLEHVEDPYALFQELGKYLAPGGHILVGTPNASRIDLGRPDDFGNEVHVPYHLHIYTRETVESFGRRQGWTTVDFYDRPYHDLPWPGLNARAAKVYQELSDGTLDAVLEPVRLRRVLTSPRFLFFASLGYWLSFHSDMAIMFRSER